METVAEIVMATEAEIVMATVAEIALAADMATGMADDMVAIGIEAVKTERKWIAGRGAVAEEGLMTGNVLQKIGLMT